MGMNCSTGSAPSPPGFATEAEALYNVLLTLLLIFFLSLELGASLMLHKLLSKTLCFPPLGRLRQLVWDPDTCQEVTATSRASK